MTHPNKQMWTLTPADCRFFELPPWWAGRPMHMVRFVTIEMN